MTALDNASKFCQELQRRHVPFHLMLARPDALMVSVALPGERWEIEFFDDDRIELERFVSQGVEDSPNAPPEFLRQIDE